MLGQWFVIARTVIWAEAIPCDHVTVVFLNSTVASYDSCWREQHKFCH